MTPPEGKRPQRWTVEVHDRPASVERVLGTLRRRRVDVRNLSVARSSPSTMAVVIAVQVGETLAARVCAEMEASPDVIEVQRSGMDEGTEEDETTTPTGWNPVSEATLFEDVDVNPELLRGRRVAVVGYGSQGHAHALNLRDSGIEVVVGLREGSTSAEAARAEGLTVQTVGEAVAASDVVALLIPDPVAPEVYRDEIAPHLEPGDTLLLAHGFNVHYGEIDAPPEVDVVLVAPKSPGDTVRQEFSAGRGVPALLAVHQDASGSARGLALAYAHALGCTRAGVLETTFAAETETDLFGEQAVLCGGFSALVKAGFETLVEAGYDPRLAYFECLHELKLIVDLAYAGGLSGMRSEVSDTAEFGDYVSGDRVIGSESRKAMREILEDVRSGRFARKWVQEWRQGGSEFARMRETERGHPLDEVGEGLRSRMAWLDRRGHA